MVPLPGWYADCEGGMCALSLFQIRLRRHMVSIFRNDERSMMGRRFEGGPRGFPGLGMGARWPRMSSSGACPVEAVLLKIWAIC